ncbi:MAG: GNAT family protein [Chlamydiota bacterium]
MTALEFTVGPLSPDRWEECRDLRLQALSECPEAFGIAVVDEEFRSAEEWKEAYFSQGKWFVFAQVEGKLIGMLGAEVPSGSYMQHQAEIIRAYVAPPFRKQGVMGAMFYELKSQLQRNPQLEQMIAWVTRNPETHIEVIYEKLGFKYAGVLPNAVKVDGKRYDCCWLVAPL